MNYMNKLFYQSILQIIIFIQNFKCQNNDSPILLRTDRHPFCVNPMLRLDNGGVLVSHKQFSSSYYPNKLDCDFLIRAPNQYRVVIQFNFLNVEKEPNCNSDYIEFDLFPIFNTNKTRGIVNNNKTRICGNNDNDRLISLSNQMIVRFHSDSSINYEGFSLRYYFMSDIDVKSGLVSWTKSFRNCTGQERQCESTLECYPKEFKCDGIKDCRDNSDELECAKRIRCHQSQFRCKNGDCIAKELWCNGYKDCLDNSDEGDHCSKPVKPQPVPSYDTSLREERCSRQVIKPKKLKLDKNITISDDDSQIIGGDPVKPGSWPWVASLRYGNFHLCGASLIRKQWAITAAHCVILNPNPNDWRLDLGRYFKEGKNPNIFLQSVKISEIIIHPDYNIWTFSHDIALLKLENEVILNEFVQTVCLPSGNGKLDETKRCVILGWGYSEDLVNDEDGVLKQAVVPIVEEKVCRENYKGTSGTDGNSLIDKSMLCAGFQRGGVDSCQGDSGGPLLCLETEQSLETERLFRLYGIISWGEGCALPNRPGVYSKITNVQDWIIRYVGVVISNSTSSPITTTSIRLSSPASASKVTTETKSITFTATSDKVKTSKPTEPTLFTTLESLAHKTTKESATTLDNKRESTTERGTDASTVKAEIYNVTDEKILNLSTTKRSIVSTTIKRIDVTTESDSDSSTSPGQVDESDFDSSPSQGQIDVTTETSSGSSITQGQVDEISTKFIDPPKDIVEIPTASKPNKGALDASLESFDRYIRIHMM